MKIPWLSNLKIEKWDFLFYGVVSFVILILLFLLALYSNYTLVSSYFGLNKGIIDTDIVVVALDEETLNSNKFKRYQDITRCDYATLLRNILYGDPKVVVMDTVFYQKGDNEACDRELTDILEKNPNVIIGVEYNEKSETLHTDLFGVGSYTGSMGIINSTSYNSFNVFNFNLADYRNRVRLYEKWENSILPISIEAYRIAHNLGKPNVIDKTIVFEDGTRIPLDEGHVNINFFTPAYKSTGFIDVLENSVRPTLFADKVVFVGATAQDIHDEFLTPYDTSTFMPGVMIHANLYNTLTTGKFIDYENLYDFLLRNILIVFLCGFILASASHIVQGVIFSFGIIVLYVLVSIGAFQYIGIIIEIFPLIISYAVMSLAIYFKKFIEERESKNQVKEMFSRYISEDVANELIKKGIDSMHLGGAEREVTVFFSDLAGFTDLSENLKPEELGRILNIYFEEMSSIILAEKGTIDKFIGDAIMAFWNAPLDLPRHANNACTAALLQRQALEKVRAEIKALGCQTFIDMRIGINTGKAIIGNFGCSRRYDYTALGDTVNLASRLESINKQYGTNIIISEDTYAQIGKDRFIVRELDIITVKGKTKPIKIYELLGFNNLKEAEKLALYTDALKGFKEKNYEGSIEKFKQIWDIPSQNFITKLRELRKVELYGQAIALYRSRKFPEARALFEKIGDNPSKKFMERCDEFIKNPPPEDWDMVYRFKVK